MSVTIRAKVEVPPSRTVTIELPPEVPLGAAELTVTVEDRPRKMTGAELAKSEFAGDWADREDLPNTPEEFEVWRRRLWEGDPS